MSRAAPFIQRCRDVAGALALGAATLALPAPAAGADAVPMNSIAQRVKACTACHGEQGRAAPDGFYPRIAGKPAGYLYNQLVNFRDGRRHAAAMEPMVEFMTDAYLAEIAAYFAGLDLPYAPPLPATAPAATLARGEELVRRGDAGRDLPACQACHGEALTGVRPGVPGLLGLPRDYLVGQIGAWQTGQRRTATPDCMARVVRQLTPEDVSAITQWLAAQPVPQPAHPADAVPQPAPLECAR